MQIPVCLWFLTKNKNDGKHRDRRKQTLFIDARKLGTLIDRVHRELTDADIAKIVGTYHAWRSNPPQSPFAKGGSAEIPHFVKGGGAEVPHFEKGGLGGIYQDIPGFCKSADLDLIKQHGYVLTPGRYVGAEEIEDDGEPFEEKMTRLVVELNEQFAESAKLEQAIRANLKGLGHAL